ncbi:hypothetical protein J4729_16175 [Leisingera sp. HS039]|uniref:hypothetical protein n=1 Tax=unclassified Leisingera TaxID=2614906 RepID=UPI00107128E8|nr:MULTISPECIES: hypothetical protein [unclassified Leisingera]MBQ4826079.1 hypothetical protein [Leisingera sp. HS039]QBR35095.1 hypothetical protein ETW23_01885 [Leisingera sp. NJS201]
MLVSRSESLARFLQQGPGAMQSGLKLAVAANFFSTSIETSERVCYHHHPEFQTEAAELMNGKIEGFLGD